MLNEMNPTHYRKLSPTPRQFDLEEARSLILRQLTRRLGTLPANAEAQVQALALPELEVLGEALLDFTVLEDLSEWLQNRQSE
jgi:Domain of unknown function (DUF4351)